MEQEDVPIGCGEHQSLVTRNQQDINFTISLGFPKTWLRLVGLSLGSLGFTGTEVTDHTIAQLCA